MHLPNEIKIFLAIPIHLHVYHNSPRKVCNLLWSLSTDDNSSGDEADAAGESWAHRVPPSLAQQSVSPVKASSSKETTPIKVSIN